MHIQLLVSYLRKILIELNRTYVVSIQKLGILNEHEAVETHEYFHNEFRSCKIVLIKEKIHILTVCYLLVWADNGDILSKQYAGTGALKSDFTRTGQRTTYGALRDGANSLYRYVINNFYDGSKQVCDSEIVLAY